MSIANQVTEFIYRITRGIPWGRYDLPSLIADAERVREEFNIFLENGGRVIVQQCTFPLWRTVTLGRHQNPEAYLASIEARGRNPNKWARDIAAKTVCSQQEVELPLVDISGADLGFTQVYTYDQFLERAATFGLYRCPAETGLALADQFDGQPHGDYRRIAMKAITDSEGGGLRVFIVGHVGGDLWLEANDGHPESLWLPVGRWVLTTRKP